MNNVKINLIWQIHQPFFIPDKELVWRVNSSYLPLIDSLTERKVPFSLNITGGTLERLAKLCPDFIIVLRKHIKENIITFFSSVAYHPVMPFLTTPSMRAQINQDQDVKNILKLPHVSTLWPTELAWSMRVGIQAASMGLKSVVIDSYSRDQIGSFPLWTKDQTGLKPEIESLTCLGTTPLLKLNVPFKNSSKSILLKVRERLLSDTLVDLMSGDDENRMHHLTKFINVVKQIKQKSWVPELPLILAEDVERIFPNSIGRFLDLLDNLIATGVEFIDDRELEQSDTFREVEYVPAGTMEGDDKMWISTFDDKVFKEHIERLSQKIENVIDFEKPKNLEEKMIRNRLLKIQDSGFYFWRYIPRTRAPFYTEVAYLENWLSNVID